MKLIPRIEILTEKKLVGKRSVMSFANNKTGELWRNFMQARATIQNPIGDDRFSVQHYHPLFFDPFDPNALFEKLAAVEVINFSNVPSEMETYILPGGMYAVFEYRGNVSMAAETFRYILQDWLPASPYRLDDRPHFEILGAKYKNGDPFSEEEIWIPIMPKDTHNT